VLFIKHTALLSHGVKTLLLVPSFTIAEVAHPEINIEMHNKPVKKTLITPP
jgi:hypothetical protein